MFKQNMAGIPMPRTLDDSEPPLVVQYISQPSGWVRYGRMPGGMSTPPQIIARPDIYDETSFAGEEYADDVYENSEDRPSSATPPSATAGTRKRSVMWSEEQDAVLIDAVKKHDGRNWKAISESVGGDRSHIQCLHR